MTKDDVERLAALVRTAPNAHVAVVSWHETTRSEIREPLARVARAVSLGAAPPSAIRALVPGPDAARVATLLELQARAGGDLAGMLDGLVAWMRTRTDMQHTAETDTAAVRLSGRLVSGLPLAALPFVPYKDLARGDALSLALVSAGLLLVFAGSRWMSRLVPRRDEHDDGVAVVCDLVASLVVAGVDFGSALREVTRQQVPGLGDTLQVARRRVELGIAWPEALRLSGVEGLHDLASVAKDALDGGSSPRAPLKSLADVRRRHLEAQLAESSKKAAVLMVLPLTLCVLPGFLALAVLPFVRGITGP